MITFDAVSRTISVYTGDVWYGGDYLTGVLTKGTYEVEIRAWTNSGTQDTGVFSSLTVQVNNPCA